MSEDHKKQLEQQLWNIANTLRGKMNADEFRDYILGFIFYKYLSEKMWRYADIILKQDKIRYTDIDENSAKGKEYIEAIKEESLEKLGRTESAKNELISKVLFHLDQIDFHLENTDLDVLSDAYEYLIGQFASGAGKKAA